MDAERDDTEKMPRGSGGRDWSNYAYGRRNSKDGHHHLKLEETQKDPPLWPSEEAWPCYHPDFRLLASKTMR